MATITNVKAKRRKGGWIEVVEELPASPAPEIVAGTRAAEIPKLALSIKLSDVVAAHEEVLGGFKWRQFNEGAIDLSEEEKTKLLETILGCSPNIQNVQSLFEALHVKDHLGWTIGGSCPAIVRIADEFLQRNDISIEPPQPDAEIQRLLDALNNRSGVSS